MKETHADIIQKEIDQGIRIGDEIEISITKMKEICKNWCSAPRSISILRKEIIEEMKDSNIAAAVKTAPTLSGLKNSLVAGSAKQLIDRVRAKKNAK